MEVPIVEKNYLLKRFLTESANMRRRRHSFHDAPDTTADRPQTIEDRRPLFEIGCTLRRLLDEYLIEMRSTLEELERLPSVFDDREQLRRRYVAMEQLFAAQRHLINTIVSDVEACKSKVKLGEPDVPEERAHTQIKGEPRRLNLSLRHRSTEDYTDDFVDEDFPDTQAKEPCQNGADVDVKEALDAATKDENADEDDIFLLLWNCIKQEKEDEVSTCDGTDSKDKIAQVPPTQGGDESNASWHVEFTDEYLRWRVKQEEESRIEELSGSTALPERSISVSTEIASPDEGDIEQSRAESVLEAAVKKEEALEAQTQTCKTDMNRSDSTEILDSTTAEPAPKISTATSNDVRAEGEENCAPDSTVTEEDLAIQEESKEPFPGAIVHNDVDQSGVLSENLVPESSNCEVEKEVNISSVSNAEEDILGTSSSTVNLNIPDLENSNNMEVSVNEKSEDQISDDSSSNTGDDEDLLVPIEVHEVPSDDPESSIKTGKRTDDEQESLLELLSKIVDSDSLSSSTTESDEEEMPSKEKAVDKTPEKETVIKKCSVVIKLNRDEMKHVKVNSDVKRLFNLDSLESHRRRRILSTSSESSTDSRKAKRKRLRLKRPKSKEFVSDSDDSSDSRESGVSDFSMDNIAPSGEEYRDEELDADDILKNIRDSEDELSDVEDVEDDPAKKKTPPRSSVKAPKESGDNKEAKDDWKSDALLTKSLNVGDPVEDDETKLEEKLNRLDKMVDERMRQIYGDDKKDPLGSGEDDVDSEIEFVSITQGTKRKRAIIVDSDESSVEEVDADDSSQVKGRRNIRAVISEDTLEETTKLAKLQEEQHEERLQEKRRKMELILSQSDMSEQEVNLILDVLGDQTVKVNEQLARVLKEHQKKGIQFMWDACYESIQVLKDGHSGSGCILAHCMGLGKTLQVVTLVRTLYSHQDITGLKRVLVVCPLSTVLNWKNEFNIGERIADDGMKIDVDVIFSKAKAMRTSITNRWLSNGGVLVMGYETFVSLTKNHDESNEQEKLLYQALVEPGADLVVCDEGHLLKNNKTSRTQCLSSVRTKRRIVLTGTPMQNNLDEYYHMVQFVKPNLLGTYKEFRNRFINPITNGQYHDSTEYDIILMKRRSHVLHSMLRNTLQRYEVTELQTYLPEKLDFVLFVPLHDVQKQLYKKSIELISSGRLDRTLIKSFSFLQPIWTHPHLLEVKEQRRMSRIKAAPVPANEGAEQHVEIDESHIEGVPDDWWKSNMPEDCATNVAYGPKFEIVLNIVRECEKAQDKVLIFSTFLYELDVLERFLQQTDPKWKRDVNYLRMDGMVQSHIREEYCMRFNKAGSKFQLMLITHRVGGLGLNLTAANRVVLMDVCWNPSYDSQAIFRIYRFGQTKPCYVYRLVSLGTMEEVVYERSVTKLAIAGRVVDEMQISRHYKSKDVIYRCNLDTSEERPVPKLPPDSILATLLQVLERQIYKYHEHESLLMNLPEEELDEIEMKLAWEEFNHEKEKQFPEVTVPANMVYNPVAQNVVYNPVYLNNFLPRQTDPSVPSTSAETAPNPPPLVLRPNMSRIMRNLKKLRTSVVYVNPPEVAQENVPSVDVVTIENVQKLRSPDVIEIE